MRQPITPQQQNLKKQNTRRPNRWRPPKPRQYHLRSHRLRQKQQCRPQKDRSDKKKPHYKTTVSNSEGICVLQPNSLSMRVAKVCIGTVSPCTRYVILGATLNNDSQCIISLESACADKESKRRIIARTGIRSPIICTSCAPSTNSRPSVPTA